jgi:hypothetical protein
MTDLSQIEARLRHLETMFNRMYAKVMGEEMPAPPKPFVEEPYQPIDWTARMSMAPQALAEMTRVGCGDPRADAAALTAGRGMVKQGSEKDPSQRVMRSGWQDERPLSSFGQSAADRMVDGDLARRK